MSDLWLVSVFKQRCINYAFASRLRHLKQVYTLVITKRCIHVQANQWASFTIRAYERGTKARLSFSGGPHAPVNMADSMEEVNEGGKKRRKMASLPRCTALYFVRQVFTNPWRSLEQTDRHTDRRLKIESKDLSTCSYGHVEWLQSCDNSSISRRENSNESGALVLNCASQPNTFIT